MKALYLESPIDELVPVSRFKFERKMLNKIRARNFGSLSVLNQQWLIDSCVSEPVRPLAHFDELRLNIQL